MNCTVHFEPTGNRLTDAHIAAFAEVAHLYDGQDPANIDTYRRRADQVTAWFSDRDRAKLVRALDDYAARIGASAVSRRALARLHEPNAVAVVTGQQAGLFTGPLYAIAKALTAIGYARRLEVELDRPVVPVFWIASEDHDWGEVNHAYIIDAENEVRRIVIADAADLHQMVAYKPLTESAVETVLQQVYRLLPEGPYSSEMMDELRTAWHPRDTLADWFARSMASLLANHPIVFLDPCLPSLRSIVGHVFARALEQSPSVQASLEDAYKTVSASGFSHEVVRDPLNTTVFYVESGKRYVLEEAGDGKLRARGHGRVETRQTWARLALDDPTRFSSNVLLRPVIQDHLLPTLAYVGGPSELAYHPLARGVFHAHDRVLPPLIMRQRQLLLPPAVCRNLAKWNVDPLAPRPEISLVEAHIHRHGGAEVTDAIARVAEDVRSLMSNLTAQFTPLGPQVSGILDAELRRELAGLERVERKLRRLVEQRLCADVRQLRQIERWLWTDGHPQERRLCPLNLWALLGRDWFGTLPTHGDYQVLAPIYCVRD